MKALTQTLFRTASMPSEIEVLLCSGQSRELSRGEERLARLLRGGVDWDQLLYLARWHRLYPLLYWNLVKIDSPDVPWNFMETLREYFVNNANWALKMTGELLNILESFEQREIVAVPYKGPALADRLYGNVGLRISGDLDILVRKQDVHSAKQALLERGYRSWGDIPERNEAFMLASRYSERFDRTRDGITVELHWAFTNKDVAFPLTLDDLLPRVEERSFGGRRVPDLATEDLLLVLCVHGAKHHWNRLDWICGVAEILSGPEPIAWYELLARAKAARSERVLLLGLALVRDLFNVPLPTEVTTRVLSDRRVLELTEEVRSTLIEMEISRNGVEPFGSLEHDLFHMKLRDGTRDQLRYLFYRMTTPSRPQSWRLWSIGGRSWAVHSLVRPFRVGAKLIPLLWVHALKRRRRRVVTELEHDAS